MITLLLFFVIPQTSTGVLLLITQNLILSIEMVTLKFSWPLQNHFTNLSAGQLYRPKLPPHNYFMCSHDHQFYRLGGAGLP